MPEVLGEIDRGHAAQPTLDPVPVGEGGGEVPESVAHGAGATAAGREPPSPRFWKREGLPTSSGMRARRKGCGASPSRPYLSRASLISCPPYVAVETEWVVGPIVSVARAQPRRFLRLIDGQRIEGPRRASNTLPTLEIQGALPRCLPKDAHRRTHRGWLGVAIAGPARWCSGVPRRRAGSATSEALSCGCGSWREVRSALAELT